MSNSPENKVTEPKQQLPPFASWPTIKILSPPKGRFSPKTDEWCLTYCTQNVNGRYHGKDPVCRSMCIRKVFAHEVKNIVAFRTHRNLGPDGMARYPLPSEGQPSNLPRWLGGNPPVEEPDEEPSRRRPSPSPVKHWEDRWYLWTSKNRIAIHDHMESMKQHLPNQQKMDKAQQERRELWQDYHDHLQKGDLESSKWWGPIVPRQPLPDFRSESMLMPILPEFPPFWNTMSKVFAPTQRALSIFHESITSGTQQEFAERVWEKAWTTEPFVLASRACAVWYKIAKDADSPSDDDKKSP